MPRFNIDVMQEQVGKLYRTILDLKAAHGTPEREATAPAGSLATLQGTALEGGQNRAGAATTRADDGEFAQPTRPRGA
jgi:hypothetical protein